MEGVGKKGGVVKEKMRGKGKRRSPTGTVRGKAYPASQKGMSAKQYVKDKKRKTRKLRRVPKGKD